MKETFRKSLGNGNEAIQQSIKLIKIGYDHATIKTGKPREDILGLPHSLDGYNEAKRIFQDTYGKDIWVDKALIKDLEGIMGIHNTYKIKDVRDFYNKLARTVRTLKMMNKLQTAQSFVYSLMDKLGPAREILTQNDDGWEEWGLEQLVEKLRSYEHRSTAFKRYNRGHYDKAIITSAGKQGCIYCGLQNHKSEDCTKVLNVARRKEILTSKRLCYECIGYGHSAANCQSRRCRKCNKKHHTSNCQNGNATMDSKLENKTETMGTVFNVSTTIHPTVIAKVNGKKRG
ncbi:uncharacterized protein LOC136078600 [Hydra vulgaris]|uniref:Uncharacterized protein LOC136078600 n=1 Tax=Hydra vulgaris TaxID=6087 RepID=A0ABM4BMZ5_HYDVU